MCTSTVFCGSPQTLVVGPGGRSSAVWSTGVTCTESCQDETNLVKDAGEYYLDVKATGPWSIVIEEMR